MSDLSVMDYFLSKNPDKIDYKIEPDVEIFSTYDNPDLLSSEFFDSILSLDKNGLDISNLDSGLFENLKMDESLETDLNTSYDDNHCETSTFSDSGLSSELQEMPDQILSDDELFKTILNSSCVSNESEPEPEPQAPVIQPAPVKNVIVSPAVTPTRITFNKPQVINIKPFNKSKQVIKVQPMNVNVNSRSVLLPINIKDLKTIKIINANSLKTNGLGTVTLTSPTKIKRAVVDNSIKKEEPSPTHEQRRRQRYSEEKEKHVNEQEAGNQSQYPPLLLTPEEKRLLNKDGIQLPCRYPLTKHEERELKRIRRKIRNKISAQDSRKRKKEYVDGLEERVKQCSEENRSLQKRIKLLQFQNSKLSSQLSKLQALVFKTGTSRAHPATCLMIVLLSIMLVTLPNLRHSNSDSNDKELSTLQQYVVRRALLFSEQTANEDIRDDTDLMINTNRTSMDAVMPASPYVDGMAINESYEVLHKYLPPTPPTPVASPPSPATVNMRKRYIEPDIDEQWPPEKRMLTTAEQLQRINVSHTPHYE